MATSTTTATALCLVNPYSGPTGGSTVSLNYLPSVCTTGYYLANSITGPTCTACTSGFASCPAGSTTGVTTCLNGYYYASNVCTACSGTNVATCSSATSATTCSSSAYYVISGANCVTCPS